MAGDVSLTMEEFKVLGKFFTGATGAATANGAGGGGAESQQLAEFIQSIPIANDDDVIEADHHNTLREAIVAIARGMDETQFARVVPLHFTPVLQPILDAAAWRVTEGRSIGPEQGSDAAGWMPLQLPDGTDVDSLLVRGSAPKKPSFWSVAVRRIEHAGAADPEDIAGGELQSRIPEGGGAVSQTFPTKTKDLTSAQASDLRRVDNSKYRYVFSTTLDSPEAGAVELTLVQVTCTR